MPRLTAQELGFFLLPLSSLLFPSLQGLHMRGYQHHRRPSRISWYSPCQHHRGAEWLAEFHTLVQASQRMLWACPRNASRPQPQSLALTGSKRGRRKLKKEIQLSRQKKRRRHTLVSTIFIASWIKKRPRWLKRPFLKRCCICNITPLEMSDELKTSNECCHHSTLRLWVMGACFP